MTVNPAPNITEATLSNGGPTSLWEAMTVNPAPITTEAILSHGGPPPLWEALVTIFILGLIILFVILGNVFVIVSVFTYQSLRIVPNYLIASLATADLLLGIFVLPISAITIISHDWIFNLELCKAWLTLDVTFCTASILNLCAIAFDRYHAISNPTDYRQKRTVRRCLCTIAVVWVVSLFVSLPPLFGWNNWDGDVRTCEYVTDDAYTLYSGTLSFYLPLIIMTIIYYKTLRCIKAYTKSKMERLSIGPNRLSKISIVPEIATEEEHASKRKSVMLNNETKRGSISLSQQDRRGSILLNHGFSNRPYHNSKQRRRISVTKETRAARILPLLIGMFVLCWLPFFVMLPVLAVCPSCSPPLKVFHCIVWLGYVNSAVNPVIYTIFNDDFKKAYNILLNKVIGPED